MQLKLILAIALSAFSLASSAPTPNEQESERVANFMRASEQIPLVHVQNQRDPSEGPEEKRKKIKDVTSDIETGIKDQANGSSSQIEDNDGDTRRQQMQGNEYLIGLGLSDITGPAADINLVSVLAQLTASLLTLFDLRPPSSQDLSATIPYSTSASSEPITLIDTSGLNNVRLLNNMIVLEHPSWSELTDIKLRLRINLNPLSNLFSNDQLIRWVMPNQIKIQAEYTYASLVVQW